MLRDAVVSWTVSPQDDKGREVGEPWKGKDRLHLSTISKRDVELSVGDVRIQLLMSGQPVTKGRSTTQGNS